MIEIRHFLERTVVIEPDEADDVITQEGLIATIERNSNTGELVLCLYNFYYENGKPVYTGSVEIPVSDWNQVVQICNELVEGSKMVANDEKRKSTIVVSWKLKKKLQEFGKMGETYEDVIWRLVEEVETLREDMQTALQFIYSKGLAEEYAKFLIEEGKAERVLNINPEEIPTEEEIAKICKEVDKEIEGG